MFFPPAALPDEIQHLWRKAATIAPIPGSDLQVGERGPESTDSEKETEREMMEVPEREEQRLEPSPEEVRQNFLLLVLCRWGRWTVGQDYSVMLMCLCLNTGPERNGGAADV